MNLTGKFNETFGEDIQLYEKQGFARNVDFVLPDGRRFFRNYAYLTGADYSPEENTIVLTFTGDTVTIKGRNLERLYEAFMQQAVRVVRCVGKRYVETKKDGVVVVGEIIVVTPLNQ